MDNKNYLSLIFKKLKGDISLEEQSMLDVWEGQAAENEQLVKEMEADWKAVEQYETTVDMELDVAKEFKALQQRIDLDAQKATMSKDNMRIAHQPIGKVVDISKNKSTTRWIGWAAAAVIALAVGFWFTSNPTIEGIEMVAMETGNQEKQTIQLADGTKVYLNEHSTLNYPTAFTGTTREIALTGEAFFEVAKNAAQPFIITTNKAKVTVLGTSFNVRAKIAESTTEVVVKTGKVRLENTAGDKKVELIANEKGVYEASNNTIKESVENDMNEIAWMSDKLFFKDVPLGEVIEDLAKQFDVAIKLENTNLKDCKMGGTFKMSQGVKSILDFIATDFRMELKILGNTAYELIGGECK